MVKYTSQVNKIIKEVHSLSQEAAEEVAKVVLEKSQETVPVKTGELRDSGHTETEELEAFVVYDAPHSAIVHENPNSRGYKFLEYAAKSISSKELNKIIKEHLSKLG